MAFPFETQDEIASEETLKIPREYEIDFATGQFTGKIMEGAEAIKVWIYNALMTPRYRYNIFSWNYGSELEDLIGESYTDEYIQIEAKRIVEDCLSVNEYITSISDFSISVNEDNINLKFTANTPYGEVEINV